ncbi:hypothetical protein SK128_007850 [Halocaridina rubra]|uniref:Uncharacterized protein n=1 Tax=Halocaridina rubra TaxID=373956 RepID=A0AAN8XE65_HALRR
MLQRHVFKVIAWLSVFIAAVGAAPDGGYGHHHAPSYHHDPYHHHKPYYFDYTHYDHYGGSHRHIQKSDGYDAHAEYSVKYPDGKSHLTVKFNKK